MTPRQSSLLPPVPTAPVPVCPFCKQRYTRVGFHAFDEQGRPLRNGCTVYRHDEGRVCHASCTQSESRVETP